MVKYTDAQKLAYYKKLASGKSSYTRPKKVYTRIKTRAPVMMSGKGSYELLNRGYDAVSKASTQKEDSFLGRAGRSAGNAISNFFGLGAYSVKENVLMQDPLPVINKSGSGSCTIRHREYIGDVITSATAGAFSINSYPINAAQEKTFPWLAQIACNFEQYKIEGMLFEYRTMSADALNSVNTALGQVIMATDYNAANPPFTQKSEMENYEFGQSAKPSESQIHPIECARGQTTITELYTRSDAAAPGTDIRMYDLGNFQIATNGFQGTSVNVGELWVTYQVTFLKSKMFASLGNYNTFATYLKQGSVPGSENVFGLSSGEGSVLDPNWSYNTIPVSLNDDGLILFPQSQLRQSYIVQVVYLCQGAGAAVPTIVPSGINCDMKGNGFRTPIVGGPVPDTGVASQQRLMYQVSVQTHGNGVYPAVKFEYSGSFPGGPINCYVFVAQIPNNAW